MTQRFRLLRDAVAIAVGVLGWLSESDAQSSPGQVKLLASDGAAGDFFGLGAIDGDTAIIGAHRHDHVGLDAGAAYVFRFNGAGWVEAQELLPADLQAGDLFGLSVAMNGGVAVIGAPQDPNIGSEPGVAYVFRFDGSSWIEAQKLVPNDGGPGDAFGEAVAIAGDAILVGAVGSDSNGTNSGAAYVFRFDGFQWAQEQKLIGGDTAASDAFSGDVAISTDVALIGAALHDAGGVNITGAAYVFRFDTANAVWVQEQKLLPADVAQGDSFGFAVTIGGDTAVIGSRLDDDNGLNSGSAYVFSRVGSTWTEVQKLLAADGDEGDVFSGSVRMEGDRVVIGAVLDDDNGLNSGSTYLFRFDGAQWTQEGKILAGDGAPGDSFGAADLSGDRLLIGSFGDDDSGPNSGSAYIVNVGPASLILSLIDDVLMLDLPGGLENGLIAKLNAALIVLEDDNPNNDGAAVAMLEAFVNQVQAQSGKQIPEADAQALIIAALLIIEALV